MNERESIARRKALIRKLESDLANGRGTSNWTARTIDEIAHQQLVVDEQENGLLLDQHRAATDPAIRSEIARQLSARGVFLRPEPTAQTTAIEPPGKSEQRYRMMAKRKAANPDEFPDMNTHEVMAYLQIAKSTVYGHPHLERVSTGTKAVRFKTKSVIEVKNSAPE